MKLPVNIPTAILIALVVFYAFIIFSYFTKNLQEGLENKEEEDLEESEEVSEDTAAEEEEEEEEEETMLEKMSRIESEVTELQGEIDKRNKELDELRTEIEIPVVKSIKK